MNDADRSPSEDLNSRDLQLAEVLGELTDRLQQGDPIDIDEIRRTYPDLADDIVDLWGAVLVADVAGSDASPVTEDSGTSSFDSSFDLPCQMGDYLLEEEVGRGGMGVVFRAQQISLGREVAVKMILRGDLASQVDRNRFRAEAEAAARLEHPNIVQVYEVSEHGESPFFSLRYIEGQTLAELLRDGPLTAREAARILAKVARGVEFAHRAGVLHRDLKPSNILLDENGEPYVTDFGLAKREADATLTRTGAVIGTPAYMSPEQAVGSVGSRNNVGPASDVYSLGSILYHMLTGRPPFQAASAVDVLLMVREQDPAPPRVVNPRVDRDMEMIALRCLQKPADLRYRSAASLADDLEAYLNDEPLAVRSGRLMQVLARAFRETHHATVLENWGLLWMWHSLVLLGVCFLTNVMHLRGNVGRWNYIALWTLALWTWAAVFWLLRRRMGPVTFVERQIAHVWFASMVGIAALFPLEWYLQLDTLTLSPIIGVIGSMTFIVKGGILSGLFYVQAFALLLTSVAMVMFPDFAHIIFGCVAAACFFFPGLKYYRQRIRNE